MNKNKLNIIIDSVMFVFLMAVAAIGLLMKFVLINGQQRWLEFGENVNITLFGLDRHEWGTIHLIMSLVLFVFLVLHLVLRWNNIVCIYKKLTPNLKISIIVATTFIILCLLLLSTPFLFNPQINEDGRGNRHQISRHSSVMMNDFSSINKKKTYSDKNTEKERKYKNRKNYNNSENYRKQKDNKNFRKHRNRKHYR